MTYSDNLMHVDVQVIHPLFADLPPQYPITSTSSPIYVDEGIVFQLKVLWDADIMTYFSCQDLLVLNDQASGYNLINQGYLVLDTLNVDKALKLAPLGNMHLAEHQFPTHHDERSILNFDPVPGAFVRYDPLRPVDLIDFTPPYPTQTPTPTQTP